MYQYTMDEYLGTALPAPREPTYNELKARLAATERELNSLKKRYNKLSAAANKQYHRGFESGCKTTYWLGFFDAKNGIRTSLADTPRRIRRHRIDICKDERARKALMHRYDSQGLKY